MKKYNKIFFDFDGVILDSHPIREAGFRLIFEEFPKDSVDQLITFHRDNGGISRYLKIDYFYNEIVKKTVNDGVKAQKALQFSSYMKQSLTDKKFLIHEVLEFIKKKHNKYLLHIISGSDEQELRFLCKELEIDQYFITIRGSPVVKPELTRQEIIINNYDPEDVIFIGDAINDYDAAKENGIDFLGYNNMILQGCGIGYLKKFSSIYNYMAD